MNNILHIPQHFIIRIWNRIIRYDGKLDVLEILLNRRATRDFGNSVRATYDAADSVFVCVEGVEEGCVAYCSVGACYLM